MSSKRSLARLLVFLGALISGAAAHAARAGYVPIQGTLLDSGGNPINGQVQVKLALYGTDSGGTALFQETQTVTADKGFFTAFLGATSTLDLALFRSGGPKYLGISVGTDSEMSPRLSLGSTPYAASASFASDTDTLQGQPASAFAASSHTHTWSQITGTAPSLVSATAPLQASGNNVSLASGSITSAYLASGCVGASQLADGSVTASKIGAGAVGTSQLASGAVASGNIANGAVGAAQLAGGSVGSGQLASGAVTSSKIGAGAVGTSQLADGSVTSAKLADGAVGSAQLAQGAVSMGQLALPMGMESDLTSVTLAAGTNDILTAVQLTPSSAGQCFAIASAFMTPVVQSGTDDLPQTYMRLEILKDENGTRSSYSNGMFLYQHGANAYTATAGGVIPVKAGVATKLGCRFKYVPSFGQQVAGDCWVSYFCQ